MTEELSVFTPSQLGQYIKGMMDRDGVLSGVLVRGELSNYKMYPSGHHYFTLKDAQGALRCVMFRGDAASLRFRPQNGMQVIAAGRVTVFPRDGQYQLYCVRLTVEGAGDLHLAFEQLKEKLMGEGLFDPRYKKALPSFPQRIALVTSPAGAAVRDMLRILKARWPMAQVKVLPVRVQGEGAAQEIADAIRWANWKQVADLIITGRGGGSMEDLWAFNEEVVARAIFDSELPIISAVGHEPDVTIADFVADLRAATPSNAAELAVPDQSEIESQLQGSCRVLFTRMEQQLQRRRQHLEQLADRPVLRDPTTYLKEKRMLLDYQSERLEHGLQRSLMSQRERIGRLAAAMDAMSPLKVLGRGYAIARHPDGRIVCKVADAAQGDRLELKVSDGSINCRVE